MVDREKASSSICSQLRDEEDEEFEIDHDDPNALYLAQENYEYIGDGLYAQVYDGLSYSQRYVDADGIINPDGTLPNGVEEVYVEGESYELGGNTHVRIAPNGDYTCVGDDFYGDPVQRIRGNLTDEKFSLDIICYGDREGKAIIFDNGFVNTPLYQIHSILAVKSQERTQRTDSPGEFDSNTVIEFKRLNQKAIDYVPPAIVA